uniref:C-type lectin domain-containing protein n=1 Tax=Cricetulus griseus TaxID=10029 RepID=A0A8C2L9E1_CRIGR
MDASVVYADLNLARTREPKRESPPSFPPDTCRCPRWHRLALKLGCVGLILLVLGVIGLGGSVVFCFFVQEQGRNIAWFFLTSDSPAKLNCTKNWLLHRDKCIQFSQESDIWKTGLADCATKGATFLLIRDHEELSFIKASANAKGTTFWLGLYYTLPDKKWKWVNGSTLSSDGLQITGETKKDSCVAISKNKVTSEACDSHNMWICQKEPKLVSETVCNDS